MKKILLFSFLMMFPIYCLQSESIEINEYYGKVNNSFVDKNDIQSKLFLIQDAHCHYEGQSNIIGILKNLNKNYSLDAIFLEGIEGPLQSFDFIESQISNINQIVAEYFLKLGIISAPRYFKQYLVEDIPIFGIEKKELYWKNVLKFREAYPVINQYQFIFQSIYESLSKAETILFSMHWQSIEKYLSMYSRAEIDFDALFRFLLIEIQKHSLDLKDYTNLYRYQLANELFDQIDVNQLNNQRDSLVEFIQTQNNSMDWLSFMADWLNREISDVNFYKKILNEAQKIEYEKPLDQIPLWIGYLKAKSQVNEIVLYQELDDLLDQLFRLKGESKEAAKLRNLKKKMNIIFDFVHLRISKKNLTKLQKQPSLFHLPALMEELNLLLESVGLEILDSSQVSQWSHDYQLFSEFYQLAQKRDQVMIQKLNHYLENTSFTNVAVITGGFHSDAIYNSLKSGRFQTFLMTPRIMNRKLQTNYFNLLNGVDLFNLNQNLSLGYHVSVEAILEDHRRQIESIHNSMVALSDQSINPMQGSSQIQLSNGDELVIRILQGGEPKRPSDDAPYTRYRRVFAEVIYQQDDHEAAYAVEILPDLKSSQPSGLSDQVLTVDNIRLSKQTRDLVEQAYQQYELLEGQSYATIKTEVEHHLSSIRSHIEDGIQLDVLTEMEFLLEKLDLIFYGAMESSHYQLVNSVLAQLFSLNFDKELRIVLDEYKDRLQVSGFLAQMSQKIEFIDDRVSDLSDGFPALIQDRDRMIVIDFDELFMVTRSETDPENNDLLILRPKDTAAALAIKKILTQAQSSGRKKIHLSVVSVKEGIDENLMKEQLARIGFNEALMPILLGSQSIKDRRAELGDIEQAFTSSILSLMSDRLNGLTVDIDQIRFIGGGEDKWKKDVELAVISYLEGVQGENFNSGFGLELIYEVRNLVGLNFSEELKNALIFAYENSDPETKQKVAQMLALNKFPNFSDQNNPDYIPPPVTPDILNEISDQFQVEEEVDVSA